MTAFDTFNVLPLRGREPHASVFYQHPYGGIARDIFVTRDGFMRFFELDEFEMEIAEAFAGQGKVFDWMHDGWSETLGYINLHQGGRMEYLITIIQSAHSDVSRLLAIAPYLWKTEGDECNPRGIPRPVVTDILG